MTTHAITAASNSAIAATKASSQEAKPKEESSLPKMQKSTIRLEGTGVYHPVHQSDGYISQRISGKINSIIIGLRKELRYKYNPKNTGVYIKDEELKVITEAFVKEVKDNGVKLVVKNSEELDKNICEGSEKVKVQFTSDLAITIKACPAIAQAAVNKLNANKDLLELDIRTAFKNSVVVYPMATMRNGYDLVNPWSWDSIVAGTFGAINRPGEDWATTYGAKASLGWGGFFGKKFQDRIVIPRLVYEYTGSINGLQRHAISGGIAGRISYQDPNHAIVAFDPELEVGAAFGGLSDRRAAPQVGLGANLVIVGAWYLGFDYLATFEDKGSVAHRLQGRLGWDPVNWVVATANGHTLAGLALKGIKKRSNQRNEERRLQN